MMNVEIKYIDNLTFVGKGESNHWVPIDASVKAGGSGAGATPMEMLLFGVGGCTAVDVIMMLKKRKKTIDKFNIRIEAERADDHPKVFTHLHLTYRFWGKDLTEKEVARAIELSESKYCSASAMIAKSAKIRYDFEINPEG